MRNKIAILSASVPLMLSVAGAFGSELQFQTPTTDRAQQTQAHIGGDSVLRAQQATGGRDWSAAIGNGHTTSSTSQISAQPAGSPASAHWSASIGSGHLSDESTQPIKVAGNVTGPQAAHAHWTSKIGTGKSPS